MRQRTKSSAETGGGAADARARITPGGHLPPDSLRHLAVSLKRRWKRYCRRLEECQREFSEEAIHQSRVETRRLIALVELLAPFITGGKVKQVQAALKRHLETFDGLRDAQVQLRAVGKLRREWPAARALRDHLRKREDRLAGETRRDLKRIKTKRLGKLVAACRNDLRRRRKTGRPGRVEAILLRSVHSAFRRARGLFQRIDPNDAHTIHRTRIAFKKFRYMIETLAAHLPLADNNLLNALRRYQTMMGDIQDADVLLRAFDRFVQKHGVPPASARSFRAELLRRRQWLIRVYLDAAGQLLDFWPAQPTASRREGAKLSAARASRKHRT